MTTEQIKELRQGIDSLSRSVMQHGSPYGEVLAFSVNAKSYLVRAKRWLGKVLEAVGEPNPYGSKYQTVEQIVPETDKGHVIKAVTGTSDLEQLQFYRDAVGVYIDVVKNVTGTDRLASIAITQVYVSLTDARMALGEAIGALRDASEATRDAGGFYPDSPYYAGPTGSEPGSEYESKHLQWQKPIQRK